MISSRRISRYRRTIYTKCVEGSAFATNTTIAALDPLLSADDLYDSIFGSHHPIKYTFSIHLSNGLTHLSHLLANPITTPATKPHEHSQWILQIPISPNTHLGLQNGRKPAQDIPDLCVYNYSYRRDLLLYTRSQSGSEWWSEPLIAWGRQLLLETIGPEHLDSLDRIGTLSTLLSAIPDAFSDYAKMVRSLGGLYLKLPVLHTLLPNPKLDHVSLTRLTPDPPPELVQNLSLLASLLSAAAASKPKAQP